MTPVSCDLLAPVSMNDKGYTRQQLNAPAAARGAQPCLRLGRCGRVRPWAPGSAVIASVSGMAWATTDHLCLQGEQDDALQRVCQAVSAFLHDPSQLGLLDLDNTRCLACTTPAHVHLLDCSARRLSWRRMAALSSRTPSRGSLPRMGCATCCSPCTQMSCTGAPRRSGQARCHLMLTARTPSVTCSTRLSFGLSAAPGVLRRGHGAGLRWACTTLSWHSWWPCTPRPWTRGSARWSCAPCLSRPPSPCAGWGPCCAVVLLKHRQQVAMLAKA